MARVGGKAGKGRLRVVGLMSGTSADGVDAAIVDIAEEALRIGGPEGIRRRPALPAELLAFETFAYPPALRRRVFRLFSADTGRVDEVCRLNFVLGEVFADAVISLARKARIPLASIDLIGSHGQTIHHLPESPRRRGGGLARLGRGGRRRRVGSTLQIGEPCVIAERTGVTTVADFRPRDLAAGGQGAPLVPFADFVLFAHPTKHRAVQNIGGIANVTFLPAGGSLRDVLAFDTGPGNMVIDRLAERITRGRRTYDADGRLASAGRVNRPLLAELMRHPFLRRQPPKSTGREEFGAQFADALYARVVGKRAGATRGGVSSAGMAIPARRDVAMAPDFTSPESMTPVDLLATATAFTARSIADAYRRFLPRLPEDVILCGGGARNRALVAMLAEEIRPARLVNMAELGIDPDAKEAVSFAMLAAAAFRGLANNVPSATGAARPVVLGKIVPGR